MRNCIERLFPFPPGVAVLALVALACGGTTTIGGRGPGGSGDPGATDAADVADTAPDAAEEADAPSDVAADPDPVKPDASPEAEAVEPPDAVTDEGPDPCAKGSIHGVACTPSQRAYVSFAKVTLDVTGPCSGGWTVHFETTADAKGNYGFDAIPPGAAVISFAKGSFKGSATIDIGPGQDVDMSGLAERCFKPAGTKIAVVGGSADRIEDLLDDLGLEHDDFDDGSADKTTETSEAHALLTDSAKLAGYDVLFLNCSSSVQKMLESGPSIPNNIKKFAESGKSVYASDWAWAYIEEAWPQAVEFWGVDDSFVKASDGPSSTAGPRQGPGPTQQEMLDGAPPLAVPATIVDDGLAAAIDQDSTTIYFDMGTWVVIDKVPSGTVHVEGKVKSDKGDWGTRPLVVSFPGSNGKGRVIFTPFHNIAQGETLPGIADIRAILSYLVFEL
ncbi:MAG: hypothetical protein FJ087_18915 [Deltaproteobacteria bacterium]|nr:hypothetical protein [Deltaproteobacteria bacterium]